METIGEKYSAPEWIVSDPKNERFRAVFFWQPSRAKPSNLDRLGQFVRLPSFNLAFLVLVHYFWTEKKNSIHKHILQKHTASADAARKSRMKPQNNLPSWSWNLHGEMT